MNEILARLKAKFNLKLETKKRENLYFIEVDKQQLENILLYLKNMENFTHLAFLQAVDYIDDNKFKLIYMLCNYEIQVNLGIQIYIDREKATMTSIHKFWSHAWQYQRELHELYGIDFPGSPRLKESFVLEGWQEIPPMRKDFDTKKYSEQTFFPRPGRESKDPKQYMKKKLYNNFTIIRENKNE